VVRTKKSELEQLYDEVNFLTTEFEFNTICSIILQTSFAKKCNIRPMFTSSPLSSCTL
jgi:hypothetical protein